MRWRSNPPEPSTFVITSSSGETVTVNDPAEIRAVAERFSQAGPITIREVFSDGAGRWIVPPQDCVAVDKPAGPPVAQPEPEPEQAIESFVHRVQDVLHEKYGLTIRQAIMVSRDNFVRVEQWYEHGRTVEQSARSLAGLRHEIDVTFDQYVANIRYWLETDYHFSEPHIRSVFASTGIDHIQEWYDNNVPEWRAAQLLSGSARRGVAPVFTKRRRRPSWKCPMPQTLIIAGVDLIRETKRLLTVPELAGMPMPHLYVRRQSTRKRTLGMAIFPHHHIRMVDAPGLDRYDVYEVISHELGHLQAYRLYKEQGHGRVWRITYANIVEQGYGYRPGLHAKLRTFGEVSRALRGGAGSRQNPLDRCIAEMW